MPGIIAALVLAANPIVYLEAPHETKVFPEVSPTFQTGHSSLMIIRDGVSKPLIGHEGGAILDPSVSLDGKSIYYAKVDSLETSRGIPVSGAQIYRYDLETFETTQLTFNDENGLPYGILDMGPHEYPGGVVFSSSRGGLRANGFDRQVALQLYVMNRDGSNIRRIGHMNLGGALHPKPLADGRIMFSSAEGQGRRDGKLWGLWAVNPDGSHFEPLFSAFARTHALHFHCQRSNGDIAVAEYYHQNNNGFGSIRQFTPDGKFGDPNAGLNPKIENGIITNGDTWRYGYSSYPFSPSNIKAATPWAHDHEGSKENPFDQPTLGGVMGTASHPEAYGNDLLITWAKGDNSTHPEAYDLGVYLVGEAKMPWEMTKVVDDPDFHEYQAVEVAPRIVAYVPPCETPERYKDLLPDGTPFGIIGTSSVYARESEGVNRNSNFKWQGSDSESEWTNADIHSIRVLAMMPTKATSSPKRDFKAQGGERLEILGEVSVRNGGLDSDGNPDTSFAAMIPGNTPFTFALLDAEGRNLTFAQTWRQVIPGEVRTDCRGCHAHHKPGPLFEGTVASGPDYVIPKLTGNRVISWNHVEPILRDNCYGCHGPDHPEPEADFRMVSLEDSKYTMAYDSRASILSQHYHNDMPPGGKLSPGDALVIDQWIDTGMYIGPDEPDDQPPTLAIKGNKVGAFDLHGISSFKVDGVETPLPASGIATVNGTLIEVADHNGNVTRGVLGEGPQPGPGPDPGPAPMTNKQKLQMIQKLASEVEGDL